VKIFAFKKYFRDMWVYYFEKLMKFMNYRDIDSKEVCVDHTRLHCFNERPFRFPCGTQLLTSVGPTFRFPNTAPFHHETCKTNRKLIWKFVPYASKLFTPPLAFYERLKWLLKNCSIDYLVINHFIIDYKKLELFPLDLTRIHSYWYFRGENGRIHISTDVYSRTGDRFA
jgi:hypothetical protein